MNAIIKGIAKPGRELKATVDGQELSGATYQWSVDGIAIDGANAVNYVVQAADLTKHIRVEITTQVETLTSVERTVTQPIELNDFNHDLRSDLVWLNSLTGERFAMDVAQTVANGGSPSGTLISKPNIDLVLVDADQNDRSLLIDTTTKTLYSQDALTGQDLQPLSATVYPAGLESVQARQNVDLRLISANIDTNADGAKELLWLNHTTGKLYLNDQLVQINTEGNSINVDGSFEVRAADADYNGDGNSDILLTNATTRSIYMLEMNGSSVASQGFVTTSLPQNEVLVDAEGDFNGDGKSDLLLRDMQTGNLRMLQLDGTNVVRDVPVDKPLGTISPQFEISAVKDFNVDGKSDLLWTNEVNGTTYVSLVGGVDSNELINTEILESLPDWSVRSADHDLNGDGKLDLIFSNSLTSQVALVRMDGAVMLDAPTVLEYPQEWGIEQTQLMLIGSPSVEGLPNLLV